MSAPKVDVLAVMDEAHDWLYRSSESRGDDDRAANVKLARAAVAELIGRVRALKSAHEAFQSWKASVPDGASVPRSILEMNAGAKSMLFDALARIGSAS